MLVPTATSSASASLCRARSSDAEADEVAVGTNMDVLGAPLLEPCYRALQSGGGRRHQRRHTSLVQVLAIALVARITDGLEGALELGQRRGIASHDEREREGVGSCRARTARPIGRRDRRSDIRLQDDARGRAAQDYGQQELHRNVATDWIWHARNNIRK